MNNKYYKYEYAKNILETEINIILKEFERKNGYLPVEHVKSRLKSETSINQKLIKKGLKVEEKNLKNITDIVGIRIVVTFISDVYDLVSEIYKSKNIIIKEKKDYILRPKDTGYTSYHLKIEIPLHLEGKQEYIPAEIQIRTIAMDFWASVDHKIIYKFPDVIPNEIQKEVKKYAEDIRKLDRRMYEINKKINKYKQKK
jgi:putative GTP pyrophosphokinase